MDFCGGSQEFEQTSEVMVGVTKWLQFRLILFVDIPHETLSNCPLANLGWFSDWIAPENTVQ